jgi:transcription antitermination factor NusG
MASWFLLKTAPSREFKAAEALRERGYVIYLPCVEKEHRASRYIKRARTKLEPLFPNYIFCHRLIPWREMSYTDPRCIKDRAGRRLLTGLVAVSGAAEPIDEAIIGKIADTVKEIEKKQKARPRGIKAGDIAIIKSGPMEGKGGEVVAVTGSDADIAMKIFGAVRTVRARLDALEAA